MEIKDGLTDSINTVFQNAIYNHDDETSERMLYNNRRYGDQQKTARTCLQENGYKVVVRDADGKDSVEIKRENENIKLYLGSSQNPHSTNLNEGDCVIVGRKSSENANNNIGQILYGIYTSRDGKYEEMITDDEVSNEISRINMCVGYTGTDKINISRLGISQSTITVYDENGEITDGPETI